VLSKAISGEVADEGRAAKDCGQHRQAAKSSDKVALSCTVPVCKSSALEYDFF
jgi:hypothetical protein